MVCLYNHANTHRSIFRSFQEFRVFCRQDTALDCRSIQEIHTPMEYSRRSEGSDAGMVLAAGHHRRTSSSRIPFVTGPRLGDDLPRIKSFTLNCRHTDAELAQYRTLESSLTGRLVERDAAGRKIARYLLSTHRNSNMLSLWTHLPQLNRETDFKATNLKDIFSDPFYYMRWYHNRLGNGR